MLMHSKTSDSMLVWPIAFDAFKHKSVASNMREDGVNSVEAHHPNSHKHILRSRCALTCKAVRCGRHVRAVRL